VISDYHWFQSDQAKSGDACCRNLLGRGNCERAHEEAHAQWMTAVKDTTALLLLTADVPLQIILSIAGSIRKAGFAGASSIGLV